MEIFSVRQAATYTNLSKSSRDPKRKGLVYLLEVDGQTMLALRDGLPISKHDSIRFAAFEAGKSFDALKKMILAVDKLNRQEWSPLKG